MPGKSKLWSPAVAEVVVKTLNNSYSEMGLELPEGFEKLFNPDVAIITTGHQLTICGGPAFLHYKTITTIAAAKRLQKETGKPVVPVFWLASEDHDFEEVSSVRGDTAKHVWKHSDYLKKLPVGAMSLDGIAEVFDDWVADMPDYLVQKDFHQMRSCIDESVRRNESYAQLFTRWMHDGYGDLGLVILDASHPDLKSLASGLFTSELNGVGISSVLRQNSPAFVRDVNLFYSPPGSPRVGIIKTSQGQVMAGETVLNPGGESWESWCNSNAASLSPSVLLRPLYQELLLPNAIVVVGPGEMAYWKQLQAAFEYSNIVMPTVLLRNHTLVVDAKAGAVVSELGWNVSKGWWTEDDFIRAYVEGILQKDHGTTLDQIKTDPSRAVIVLLALGIEDIVLHDALKASGSKLRKASKTAVKKIRQTIKAQHSPMIDRVSSAALSIYRNGSPQDRWANFHALSSRLGGFKSLMGKLVENSYSQGGLMQVVEEEF